MNGLLLKKAVTRRKIEQNFLAIIVRHVLQ